MTVPSPAQLRLEAEQTEVWVWITVGVAALGAFGLVAMSIAGQNANGPSRRRPGTRPQGAFACVDGGSFGVVKPEDYVAVAVEDDEGAFVEYLWVFVDSISPDGERLHGKIRGSASNAHPLTDRHGFRTGGQVVLEVDCIADRVRGSLHSDGEPICGEYGALPHGLEAPRVPELKPDRVVKATVGPKTPGSLPAIDLLEAIDVRIDFLSPLGIVRGTVVSHPQKAAQHGFRNGDDVDLLPDCIYGEA